MLIIELKPVDKDCILQRIQLTSLPFLYHQPCHCVKLPQQLQSLRGARFNPHGQKQPLSRQVKGKELSGICAALHTQRAGRFGGRAQHMNAVIDPALLINSRFSLPAQSGYLGKAKLQHAQKNAEV